MFFRRQKIEPIFDVAMEEVAPGELRLGDGRKLPFKYGMVVPPFVGAEVANASGLGNAKGFIEVKDTYQTLEHPNVYAVGIAAAVNAPWTTANAVGVPKTGFPAETMAHVAAENIAAQIRGQEPTKQENFGDIPAVCIMDAGNNGVVILADRMLPPRKHGVMIPAPSPTRPRSPLRSTSCGRCATATWGCRKAPVDTIGNRPRSAGQPAATGAIDDGDSLPPAPHTYALTSGNANRQVLFDRFVGGCRAMG